MFTPVFLKRYALCFYKLGGETVAIKITLTILWRRERKRKRGCEYIRAVERKFVQFGNINLLLWYWWSPTSPSIFVPLVWLRVCSRETLSEQRKSKENKEEKDAFNSSPAGRAHQDGFYLRAIQACEFSTLSPFLNQPNIVAAPCSLLPFPLSPLLWIYLTTILFSIYGFVYFFSFLFSIFFLGVKSYIMCDVSQRTFDLIFDFGNGLKSIFTAEFLPRDDQNRGDAGAKITIRGGDFFLP